MGDETAMADAPRPPAAMPHLDEAAEAAATDISDFRWSDAPSLALFWALAGVVFLQFFSRYVMNSSIGWTEEIARYLLIGVTFVGAVIATRKGAHIAIELLAAWLPPEPRRLLASGVDVALVGAYGWMAWTCGKLALRTNQSMVSLDLPKSVIYWTVAAALAAMALYQAARAVHHWRHGARGLLDAPAGGPDA